MEVHDVVLELRPLTPGQQSQTWRVWHEGEVLIESTRDPEFDACRKLQDMGLNGKLRTKHKGAGHYAMTMGIAWGAKKRTQESVKDGPRVAKYQPFDATAAFGNVVDEVNA